MSANPDIESNQPAPSFTLLDLKRHRHSLEDYRGQIVIVNFWSAECPWSRRADEELVQYLEDWGEQVILLSIASNANESPEFISEEVTERGISPVFIDDDQQIADLYGAVTTPHVYVIDAQGIIRYQGAFDDVTFRQTTPNQHYLREAVEKLLQGNLPEPSSTPPYGCVIVRYKP